MPIIKVRPPAAVSPAERELREYDRLRYGRATKASIREVQKRMRPSPVPEIPDWRALPKRLSTPGPAVIPELEAARIVAERRAARSAAPSAPVGVPQRQREPEPTPPPVLPATLLGW